MHAATRKIWLIALLAALAASPPANACRRQFKTIFDVLELTPAGQIPAEIRAFDGRYRIRVTATQQGRDGERATFTISAGADEPVVSGRVHTDGTITLEREGMTPVETTRARLRELAAAKLLDRLFDRRLNPNLRRLLADTESPLANLYLPQAFTAVSVASHEAALVRRMQDLPETARETVEASIRRLVRENGGGEAGARVVMLSLAKLFQEDVLARDYSQIFQPNLVRRVLNDPAVRRALGAAKVEKIVKAMEEIQRKIVAELADTSVKPPVWKVPVREREAFYDRAVKDALEKHGLEYADLLAAMPYLLTRDNDGAGKAAKGNAEMLIGMARELETLRRRTVGEDGKIVALLGDGEAILTARRALLGEDAESNTQLAYVSRRTLMTDAEKLEFERGEAERPSEPGREAQLDNSTVYRAIYRKEGEGDNQTEAGLFVEAAQRVREMELTGEEAHVEFQKQFQTLLKRKLDAEPDGDFARQVWRIYDALNLGTGDILFVDSGFKGTIPTLLAALHRIRTGKKATVYLFGVSRNYQDVIPAKETSRGKAKRLEYMGKYATIGGYGEDGLPRVGNTDARDQILADLDLWHIRAQGRQAAADR